MRRASRMNVNLRTEFSEAPRCAGVIEMNVAQENMANVLRLEAGFPKIANHVVES